MAAQSSTSDEQLLLRDLSQGDRTAFWQLWRPHQDDLYHRCLTWMDSNVTAAQDALSQAALKAWDTLPHHADKITNLKAWLTRFTHNLCMDIHREGGRRAVGVDNIEERAGQTEGESPESALLGSEVERTIRRVIQALPIRLRSPFTLRFEEGMSYLDIAQKLGISIDNVYKRISQARAILKSQMNKYISEEDGSAFSKIPLPSINKEKPTEPNQHKDIQKGLPPSLFTQVEAGGEALPDRGRQCLYCQSTHLSKNGHRRGKQNYRCQKCDRQFIDSYSAKGYLPEVRERCFKLHDDGMGFRAIGRETGVSHKTVANWVGREAPHNQQNHPLITQ